MSAIVSRSVKLGSPVAKLGNSSFTLVSQRSCPSSTSLAISRVERLFDTEPIMNGVFSVTGASPSTRFLPTARTKTCLPSRTTATATAGAPVRTLSSSMAASKAALRSPSSVCASRLERSSSSTPFIVRPNTICLSCAPRRLNAAGEPSSSVATTRPPILRALTMKMRSPGLWGSCTNS